MCVCVCVCVCSFFIEALCQVKLMIRTYIHSSEHEQIVGLN